MQHSINEACDYFWHVAESVSSRVVFMGCGGSMTAVRGTDSWVMLGTNPMKGWRGTEGGGGPKPGGGGGGGGPQPGVEEEEVESTAGGRGGGGGVIPGVEVEGWSHAWEWRGGGAMPTGASGGTIPGSEGGGGGRAIHGSRGCGGEQAIPESGGWGGDIPGSGGWRGWGITWKDRWSGVISGSGGGGGGGIWRILFLKVSVTWNNRSTGGAGGGIFLCSLAATGIGQSHWWSGGVT